jgi:hypothetical protein
MKPVLRYFGSPRPRAAALLLVVTLLVPTLAQAKSWHSHGGTMPLTGQWALDRGDKPNQVSLTFKAKGEGWTMNWGSSDIPSGSLEGLDLARASSGQVEFRLRRDAGTFVCRGVMEGETGAGVYHLELDPKYPEGLERRGVGRPTAEMQTRLAYADAGYDLLDELKKQNFETPDLDGFLTMAEHGVNLAYVRDMAGLGYRMSSIADLVRARDHGVDPKYIMSMRAAGYPGLTFAQLIRARDHGVDAKYVATIRELGRTDLSLDDLIQLRDHGVDGTYVAGMRGMGFRNASLEEFQTARDHGVDPRYVSSIADAGFPGLSLSDLIRGRDHGVDAAYIRRVIDRERERPSFDEVIRLRDRGY